MYKKVLLVIILINFSYQISAAAIGRELATALDDIPTISETRELNLVKLDQLMQVMPRMAEKEQINELMSLHNNELEYMLNHIRPELAKKLKELVDNALARLLMEMPEEEFNTAIRKLESINITRANTINHLINQIAKQEDLLCAICLDREIPEQELTGQDIANCRHKFHKKCLDIWHKHTCPICRGPLKRVTQPREINPIHFAGLLFQAIENNDIAKVEHFLNIGADVNASHDIYIPNRPLLLAAERGHLPIAELLIQRGADVNQTDRHRNTALILAVLKRNLPMVQFLVANGANVNLPDQLRKTPLTYAQSFGFSEIVDFLKARGAELPHGSSLDDLTIDSLELD